MTARSHERGSAHLIIISLLVVALLGAVGYIAYTKINTPKPAPANPALAPAPGDYHPSKVVTSDFCMTMEKLCFSYPSTWKLTTAAATDRGTKHDADTLVSPDGSLTLYFNDNISGVGGTGDPTIPPSSLVVASKKLPFATMSTDQDGNKALHDTYAVESIYHDDSGYLPSLLITTSNASYTLAPGTTLDGYIGFGALFTSKNTDVLEDGSHTYVSIANNNYFYGDASKLPFLGTKQAAKDLLNKTNYQDAYTVLGTAHY